MGWRHPLCMNSLSETALASDRIKRSLSGQVRQSDLGGGPTAGEYYRGGFRNNFWPSCHASNRVGADSEKKHDPVSDIDTVVVDSLKALDPKRPIREADMRQRPINVRFQG